jgi:hypothetical protein
MGRSEFRVPDRIAASVTTANAEWGQERGRNTQSGHDDLVEPVIGAWLGQLQMVT